MCAALRQEAWCAADHQRLPPPPREPPPPPNEPPPRDPPPPPKLEEELREGVLEEELREGVLLERVVVRGVDGVHWLSVRERPALLLLFWLDCERTGCPTLRSWALAAALVRRPSLGCAPREEAELVRPLRWST